MKIAMYSTSIPQRLWPVLFLVLVSLMTGCKEKPAAEVTPEPEMSQEIADVSEEVIWHVKAVHPEGRFLDVKALDEAGNIYDVKAIQDADQRQLMDIKALMGGEKMPVKILVSTDEYAPVKAIGNDGTIYDIKALTPEGERLDVKGVSRAGNILDIVFGHGEPQTDFDSGGQAVLNTLQSTLKGSGYAAEPVVGIFQTVKADSDIGETCILEFIGHV